MAEVKRQLLEFLIGAKQAGKSVAGYGAPGKGNTLLNYCGIRQDLLDYTVDRNPYKQGKFLPGTRIPIYSPEQIDRHAARFRSDLAVEFARRNRRTTGVHSPVGRQVCRADSAIGSVVNMILLDTALAQREAEGRPIRIGLVGAGFMGRGIALQLCTPLVGHAPGGDCKSPCRWRSAGLGDAGHSRCRRRGQSKLLDQAVARGRPVATSDPALLCHCENIDAIIEVTGHVESSAATVLAAIAGRKHIVLMNAELDATLGPILKVRADEAGVIYSNADGDEPGLLLNLIRHVRTIGYQPVMAGNIKGFLDRYRTAETQRDLPSGLAKTPSCAPPMPTARN